MNRSAPEQISGLLEIAAGYRAVFADVWGVVHNGIRSHPAASDALARFRRGGRYVLLITNSPRRRDRVIAQLDDLGVDRDAYDDIVTSGDVTRDLLASRGASRVLHIGPERDLPFYEDLPVRLVDDGEAEIVSCTGLFDDETETPDDYAQRLAGWAARGLPMICANPDLVVERGDRLIPCAGALAERYRSLGGTTLVAGKPHPPIYRSALARLAGLAGAGMQPSAVLAIGDGLATDIRGAFEQELDVLFVTGGIHAAELGAGIDAPDADAVRGLLSRNGLGARAYIPRLRW